MEASNVMHPLAIPQLNKNVLKRLLEMLQRVTYLGNFPKRIEVNPKNLLKV